MDYRYSQTWQEFEVQFEDLRETIPVEVWNERLECDSCEIHCTLKIHLETGNIVVASDDRILLYFPGSGYHYYEKTVEFVNRSYAVDQHSGDRGS